MQLMKAMKKLKFWSKRTKKKKKKRTNNYYHNPNLYYQPSYYSLQPSPLPPPPPPPMAGACRCHFCQAVEPSAPPLPPWLDEGTSGTSWEDPFSGLGQVCGDNCISISQETTLVNTTTQLLPFQDEPDPVLELPVVPRRQRSASAGLFGCGVGVGSFLIRCFFPCFHISEARCK